MCISGVKSVITQKEQLYQAEQGIKAVRWKLVLSRTTRTDVWYYCHCFVKRRILHRKHATWWLKMVQSMLLTLALMLDTAHMVFCMSPVKSVSRHMGKCATGDNIRGEHNVYDDFLMSLLFMAGCVSIHYIHIPLILFVFMYHTLCIHVY